MTQAHFEAFLETTVNLKQWKLDLLDSRVTAIVNALQRNDTIGPMYKEHIPQGSWAHQTIIDPVGAFDEFDADFLLHLEENEEWSTDPGRYLREVRAALTATTTYAGKVRKKNRCVRVGYANECHVDVVPHLTLADGSEVIVNYKDGIFEQTKPAEFTLWMRERDDLTGGNLRKVIRLMKFLRDYKNTFDCKSVILTTLLGNRVQPFNASVRYQDIPTTLVTLLDDLDMWLDGYAVMPLIDDPSCPGTNFNHRWSEANYQTFKRKIKMYSGWAKEAAAAEDEATAITAWQKLFGSEFVAVEVAKARNVIVASAGHDSVLKSLPDRAPGEQFIEERYNLISRHRATIVGRVLELQGGRASPIRSGHPLHRGLKLEFKLDTDAPGPFQVIWKVRNHGDVAARANGLRGALIDGNIGPLVRRESTLYPGSHYVEVYVVKDGWVVASDHHEVVIA
jgi:hypothetical protein